MSEQLIVATLAVVASTATAIVSMIVTSRSQRSAIREQYLWQARTDAYLSLQAWSYQITDWSQLKRREPVPTLDRQTESRITLFSSPFVINHFVDMQKVIRELTLAAAKKDWETFDDLQWQLGTGWAIDISAQMQDDLRGRISSEFVAMPNNRLRLRWRYRQVIRWHLFVRRFRRKGNNKHEVLNNQADPS